MLKEYVERKSRPDAECEKTEVVVSSASGRADVVVKEDNCQQGGAVPAESSGRLGSPRSSGSDYKCLEVLGSQYGQRSVF